MACICLAAIYACESSYETGNGPLSYLRADHVDISVHQSLITSIERDDGVILTPTALRMKTETTDTVIRCILYYNQQSTESAIEMLKMTPVYLIHARQTLLKPSYHTDPVTLTSAWVSKNMRYLNISIGVLSGLTEEEGMTHNISLICDSVTTHGKGKTHAHITLAHDRMNIPEYYTKEINISLPLDNITGMRTSPTLHPDTITLYANTYKGMTRNTFAITK